MTPLQKGRRHAISAPKQPCVTVDQGWGWEGEGNEAERGYRHVVYRWKAQETCKLMGQKVRQPSVTVLN